jgi:hypothetical protein
MDALGHKLDERKRTKKVVEKNKRLFEHTHTHTDTHTILTHVHIHTAHTTKSYWQIVINTTTN